MILSNINIISAIRRKAIEIIPLETIDPARAPFNTSAIDLRLGNEILIPKDDNPTQLDLTKGGIATYLQQISDRHQISEERPFSLVRNKFILAQTLEYVKFPIRNKGMCYSARVEGKSSLARCGILIHFTAPTIHAGFEGTITLEILNLGPKEFLLKPNMYICQLIIEEVKGCPMDAPNQFRGQTTPAGTRNHRR